MYEALIIGGLSATASIVCFFCAMAGSGSGLVLMPLMIFAGLTPVQAIAIHKFEALWTVVSGWRYYKRGAFLKDDFGWYLILGLVGTFIGARFIHLIPSTVLQVTVGVCVLIVALFINFSDNIKKTSEVSKWKKTLLIFSMFFFGLYEGTFGAGNGFFIAALFFLVLGSEEHKTVGMITILAAFWNIAATLTHFTYGSLIWHYALPIGGGAMAGAWFGAGYALKVKKKTLRKIIFALSLCGGGAILAQSLIMR